VTNDILQSALGMVIAGVMIVAIYGRRSLALAYRRLRAGARAADQAERSD
jgi:hypothetical protein